MLKIILCIWQVLRLAFHDCVPYKNPVNGQVNGCDGCLNPKGMGTLFKAENQEFNHPDAIETDNNGLLWTADILEEIYTNPDFPSGVPKLDVSMKESGKSRADLWAFAGLLAAYIGIEENNLACNGTPRSKIVHFYSVSSWNNFYNYI